MWVDSGPQVKRALKGSDWCVGSGLVNLYLKGTLTGELLLSSK